MFKKQRIHTVGKDFPDYRGGVYNPSSIIKEDKIITIVRCEDHKETERGSVLESTGHPFIIELDFEFNKTKSYELIPLGFPAVSRIEDFRLFVFNNKTYASHPIVLLEAGELKIKQAVSEIDGLFFKLIKVFDSPFNVSIEKNWGFFVKDNELYMLYSISPWIIFKVDEEWNLEIVARDNFEGKWETNSFLAISSHPIQYENNFMVTIHSRESGVYIQGAIKFDSKTLMPIANTPTAFLRGGKEKGLRPKVLYISGAFILENTLHLPYGEGDTHSSIYSINKETFNTLFEKI